MLHVRPSSDSFTTHTSNYSGHLQQYLRFPNCITMDSGMQSPAMADHLLTSTWTPYNPRFMNQPLATSMHAVVPHNYIPINLQQARADTAIVRQLEDRISSLQQQRFQDGLNAHFRNVQSSQSLQHLEQQIQRMQHTQRSLSYGNSSLRFEIQNLRAIQDSRDNEECTRRIQLEPRTQEQKLQSAMRNVNLMRIYAGVSLSGDIMFEQVSVKGAEQMEALAKILRSRVNRGGAAYLLEAEDAEAWARKLREDAQLTQEHKVDNKLAENPEVSMEEDHSKVANHADAAISDVDWDACLAQGPDESVEWNIPPLLDKTATPSTRSRAPSVTANASVAHSPDILQNATWTHVNVSPANKATTYASRRSEVPRALSSAVSIEIEEMSKGNVGSVQIEAVPELQSRKAAAAPHQKYAAQQTKTQEDLSANATIEKDADAVKEEPESNIIPGDPQAGNVVEETQVLPKKLPPHRRYVLTQRIEAPKLSEVELGITTKEETPLPFMKTNKTKKSKPRRKARKMEETKKAAETASIYRDCDEPKVVVSEKQDGLEEKQDEIVSLPETKVQAWQPSYLRDLLSLPEDELQAIPSSQEMHHFERTFILSHLGGTRWLPSFYSVPEDELSLLPGRGFYLLEDTTEPLAPSAPGAHGSLLTPILRLPEENNPATPKPESMQMAPLFLKQGEKYVYYGMYSYLRCDRLDIERCSALVPTYLKTHWANQLTSANRPKWVKQVLQAHLCPPPTYSGPLPSHVSDDAASSALTAHMQTHESWHRETHLKTSLLRAEHILQAFEAPDTGAEMPGIRFWCLGLECEGWDKGFYDMMVREEKIWEKAGRRDGEKERERQKEMLRVLGKKGRPVKW